MTRFAISLLALISCGVAYANGSGTLNDTTPSLSYSGGPNVPPNPLAGDPPAACDQGLPTCDVYTLTVDLSDAFRAANVGTPVQFRLSFPDADDWDMWFYDAAGNELARSADTNNPESFSFNLKDLANGSYELRVAPFFPTTTAFDLSIAVGGAKSASVGGKSGSGVVLGAFGLPALFTLFGLTLLRRRVD